MAITVNHDITLQSNWGTLNNALGFVGTIENELQLFDVQIQIAKERAEGYYIEWKGERIDISPSGEIYKWPNGYGDQSQRALVELILARGYRVEPPPSTVDWRHND